MPAPEKEVKDLKWGVRKRLEFIERELFWTGKINRVTLMEKTGVSKAQASLDLAHYKKLADNNLIYNLSEKTYQVASKFKPLFISTSPHLFLESLIGSCAEKVPLPLRDIDPNFLRVLHSAVVEKSWVTISYQSMSLPTIRSRKIAPHSFLSDGWRWHVRAFDSHSKTFRDFVLGRINAVEVTPEKENGEQDWEQTHDVAWNEMIELHLAPHPDLSDAQRQSIAADYMMIAGGVTVPVRRACLFYVVKRLRLLDEAKEPAEQQVVLQNRDAIKELLL